VTRRMRRGRRKGGIIRWTSCLRQVVGVNGARHVVFTGGEPMLAPGLAELAGRLKARGMAHHD